DPVDADPFETLLDPARCPPWALPWLAQLVGLRLPTTLSVPDQRAFISALASHNRGTPAALEAAAGLFLTGNKTVYFPERDPTGTDPAYTLEVVTLDNETPDPAAVAAALQAQKPGGIILNYRHILGWDYQQMTAQGVTEGWKYSSLGPIFPTYRDLTNND